ncbi:TonB-dependent receptor [Psychrosphaera sp. F3M07]|uniref:TonB-dependent receptor plug domain-containing protein n=1 Tax=Psychrosphaera sp. F3M07 TaxID=2841560 RepID=UPI001C08540B|nr:TonB-dependent receptor [Psychrosphaera sp. F3M07]MBU2917006.1 TonB-dependent receptor [Psychrosphaera sp. F3M07]
MFANKNHYHLNNMSRFNLYLLLTLLSPALTQSVFAKEIETLVVSGTRTPKLLSNSPVSVDVIEGETIQLLSQGTLANVLDFIPGVVITRSAKDGYNVQMQGFDSKHVLILIDSLPVVSPTGSSVDLDQISASDIAQIEIIKGAASVMYGSSALGGVINIITNKDSSAATSLSYQISQYIDREYEGSAPFSNTLKFNTGAYVFGWDHKVNVQLIQDTGFDYDLNTVAVDAAELDKTFINYSTSKTLSQLIAQFKYQYFDEYKKRDVSVLPGQSDIVFYSSDVHQHQFDFSLNNPNSGKNWRTNTRYISHQETSGQTGSLRETTITLAEIDGQKVWQHGSINPKSTGESGSETVAGWLLHQDQLDQYKPADGSVEINDESRSSIEAYVQHNFIYKNAQYLAGFRAQQDSDFGTHTAFRISSMLNLGKSGTPIKWRVGLGQAYRVPDLKERFYVFDHSNLGYMVLGNENLMPETATSLNTSLSVRTSLFDHFADVSLEIAGHYSETEDLINTIHNAQLSAETGLDISEYSNVEQTKIYGFDVSSEVTFEQWSWQVNYAYNDSKDDNKQRLQGRPRHQAKVSVNYQFDQPSINAILYAVYQADEEIPSSYDGAVVTDYTIVKFSLSHALTEQLSLRFSVNNLFDEHKDLAAQKINHFDPRPISSRELVFGVNYQF